MLKIRRKYKFLRTATTNVLELTKAKFVFERVNTNKKENMYDITVNSKNHRYYSNGILSHNSTSYSIYVLWYILMNQNKSVLICANKFKTAKDILSRVKMAYEMLPKWLKPRNYNMEYFINRI